ncbi:hypothetical protein BTJ40_06820 [Microbulbifer sp. A4B17]|nr:hypothetical protein BTJ40_06820 [Microbulbifer sp. A4B17]
MINLCLSSGILIPPDVIESWVQFIDGQKCIDESNSNIFKKNYEKDSVRKLMKIHNTLVKIIYPRTPRAAILMYESTKNPYQINTLLSVNIFRNMMLVVVVSLFLFICFGISPQIDLEARTKYIFLELSGADLLVILLFLLSAASLGSSFACVLAISHYMEKGIFDPIYNSSYWIRYLFGIIFAIFVCTLFVHSIPLGSQVIHDIGRPATAMVAGFIVHFVFPAFKIALEFFVRLLLNTKK